MKKIKVIFTGGTIGSKVEGNNISTNTDTNYLLLNKYGKNLNRFITANPLFILSENANLENVIVMAEEINKSEKENIKGIILTHGTDTLAYTAAYLSFLLPNLSVPVVLVSSDKVLDDEEANGVANFTAAVELIDNKKIKPAVYVTYKNKSDSFTSIHLGVRMNFPAGYSDCFYSPENKRFAIFKDGKIILEETCIPRSKKTFNMNYKLGKKGLFIEPFLGLDYNVYKNCNCDFILHNLYHSGTANTVSIRNKKYETNFIKFADYCSENKITLYLCNIKKKDINYDTTNLMKEKKVKFMYDILPNVALAKLYIAYNFINKKEINEYLETNICGEFLK